VQFWSFFPCLIVHGTKTGRAAVLIFGTLVERYAARWRQRSKLFENWQLWAPLPLAL